MWYQEVFDELEAIGNTKQAEKMAAYMQYHFVFLGVSKTTMKQYIKPYLTKTRKQDLDWDFVHVCWQKPYREAQYVAIEYLKIHKKQLTLQDICNLERLITEKSWWETVDNLDALVGSIVLKNPSLKETMLKWAVSDNMWLRRVAIDFQQRYKEKTDTALLKDIIVKNLESTEFFIYKAIGWSLREYSKTNPEWVRKFISIYRTHMAPITLKEAEKYIASKPMKEKEQTA